MALPGVSIPKSVFPNIQSALEACSASVEDLEVSDEDVKIGLLAAFRCISRFGDVVLVRIHRAERVKPDGIVAVLQPQTSRLFLSRRHSRYLNQVQSSLIDHGALPVRKTTSTS